MKEGVEGGQIPGTPRASGRLGRRVLMICYHYPPVLSSGTARNSGFAAELSRLGWKPVVLTASASAENCEDAPDNGASGITVVRTVEWRLDSIVKVLHGTARRICRWLGIDLNRNYFSELVCIPDAQIAWFSTWSAYRIARRCDVVYASCSPFSSSLSACIASIVNRKPLVLDFRDAWTLNPHRSRIKPHRCLARRLEAWVLKRCEVLILNTEGARQLYASGYPQHADKLTVIPNGYDSLNLSTKRRDGRFIIMHVGRFYESRTPLCLFKAMELIGNPAIEFVQVGPKFVEYDEFSDRIPVRLTKEVSRTRALELMREASLLYVCQGFTPGLDHHIAVAAKTHEYLSTGIPILADCPEGDNVEIVRRYAKTCYVVTSQDVREMKTALESAFADRHAVTYQVSSKYRRRYSRRTLAKRLSDTFTLAQESFESRADHRRG